ncbi:MAG: DUF1013 domain-containing protein [Alphaproteobacteria bacterium]|nr:DUF1013 domain-containing protein [Alphaproteobacteria bacterium]
MAQPLMPKATAVWLVENTTLTFDQIAGFCGLHRLEVQAIADGEVAISIVGLDPVYNGQLTLEEIKRCEADPRAHLKMTKSDLPLPQMRTKGARYTPVSKRGEKPDAIAYLIKNYPELLDAQIARLLGTTKETIGKVRDRSHWNTANIKPQNPVLLGLCKQADLEAAVKRAQRRVEREQGPQETAPETSLQESSIDTMAPIDQPAEPEADQNPTEGFASTPSSQQDEQPEIDHDAMIKSLG